MGIKKVHAIMAVVVFVLALIGTQAFAAETGTRTYDQTYDRERSEAGDPKESEGHKIYGQEKEPPRVPGSTTTTHEPTMGEPKDAQGHKIYGQEEKPPARSTTTTHEPTMGEPMDAQGHKIYGQEEKPPATSPRNR